MYKIVLEVCNPTFLDKFPYLFELYLILQTFALKCELCLTCILYLIRHLVNQIVHFFQLTCGLCLTNQLYYQNVNYITPYFLLLVPSVLKYQMVWAVILFNSFFLDQLFINTSMGVS